MRAGQPLPGLKAAPPGPGCPYRKLSTLSFWFHILFGRLIEGKPPKILDLCGKKGYIALRYMKKPILLSILLLLLESTTAWGQYSTLYAELTALLKDNIDPNTGNMAFLSLMVPVGGRYEGMGTATTALARDSGYIESNPAAGSLLRNTELSFSHHNWISNSMLDGVTYTIRYGDFGVGVSGKFFYVPFSEQDVLGYRESTGFQYSESVATLNASYRFFPSYEFYGIAAGLSTKVGVRYVPEYVYPGQSALVFMTDVGVQSSFNFLKAFSSRTMNFSVGAAVKNLGFSTLASDPLPATATLGIAYAPVRPVTVSADFNLPFSLDAAAGAESPYGAVGMNWEIAPFLSVQTGFLLKWNNPRVSVGSILDVGNLKGIGLVSFVVNYNLNLAGEINPLDLFSVQARLNLGDFGRAARQTELENLFMEGVREYGEGNLTKAIENWEKVLQIDPSYTPARDYIETAKATLQLQKNLNAREQR